MNFQSALLLSRKFTEVLASQASPPHPTFTYWVQFRRRRHVDGVERDYVAVSVRKDTERAIDEHERLCGFEHLDDAHEALRHLMKRMSGLDGYLGYAFYSWSSSAPTTKK